MECWDGGHPALKSHVAATVRVVPPFERPPEFSSKKYTSFPVGEDAAPGHVIGEVGSCEGSSDSFLIKMMILKSSIITL